MFDSTADDVYPITTVHSVKSPAGGDVPNADYAQLFYTNKTNPTLRFRTTDEERSSWFQHSDWLLQHEEEKL